MSSRPVVVESALLIPLLLVALHCSGQGNAEVLPNTFRNTDCAQFFFKETEPGDGLVPTKAARICQVFNNQYRFATMYDRKNRIPIYSAYIYQPGRGQRPKKWFIEPQLVNSKIFNKAMEEERLCTMNKTVLAQSQAVRLDFKATSTLYDKGHLNPNLHHNTEESKMATFTLTNIVPQFNKLNKGAWNRYETEMMKTNSTGCVETYVIVGVVPGNKYISKGRVNVPSHIWAAACCTLSNGGVKAWTAFAENTRDDVTGNMAVKELEATLTKLFNKQIILFHDQCRV